MSNKEASKVYELIVDNVINEVREDFENAGIDEQTLQDLKRVWREKLSEVKTTTLPWDTFPITGLQQGALAGQTGLVDGETTVKKESQGLVLPGFDGDSNNANDGELPPSIKTEEGQDDQQIKTEDNVNSNVLEKGKPFELVIESESNAPAEVKIVTEEKQKAKESKRSALLDTDEVGSELDDSDDDYLISEGEDEGPDENLILCLYEKVTRTKARWKCSLKDGIATINRNDYTFQKAHVEAEWV